MKRHVLILGAGFGGLELATRLSETASDAVDVTLLDRNDSFFFGFSKLEVMLGRQSADEVRLPYDRDRSRVPRSFAVFGSTHVSTIQSGPSRRIWPVEVRRFDLESLQAARDQLWAEAALAEAAGETVRFDKML